MRRSKDGRLLNSQHTQPVLCCSEPFLAIYENDLIQPRYSSWLIIPFVAIHTILVTCYDSCYLPAVKRSHSFPCSDLNGNANATSQHKAVDFQWNDISASQLATYDQDVVFDCTWLRKVQPSQWQSNKLITTE